ncbi:alpha/beta fold hydrolase [Cryptosporangium aurantiacum]|uniref:Pimeloyl-ACP methyl ester carboxylesterase n=1 Tax=Cryptosporangium aurantiacum TaxID=134849 RepID=A0A1M7RM04_9ACTN|nr:alpha/beta hydrolase [Cryptosporangium aurantiacum]SHN47211.1 Pimeloyl-ACP methyl ester carboxylesterase [Cryptosporangium aurantiacum]
MTETQTHTLALPGVDLVYDVRGPLPTADGQPPLLLIGQPMSAEGFEALVAHFPDRTVVTYDPRGLGRSVRTDGRSDHTPQQQAADLHLLVEALGAGPVEVFGSSGGAVTGLELVATHPEDVVTLVAHEPPINAVLPDAAAADRARAAFHEAYQANGFGAGMAAFVGMTAWQGEFTDEYFAQPTPDAAAFGMPTGDDGTRDDPLLSKNSWAISDYRPDAKALTAASTRIVVAVGEETGETYTARTALGTAALLGQEAVVFPSHHGGFLDGRFGYAGKPAEFAARLREVLAAG